MQSLDPGRLLQGGKYRIVRTLGQGSFGITYLATTCVKMQAAISGSLGRLVQDQVVEVKVCVKEFFMKEVNSRGGDGSSVEGTSNTLYTNYRKRFRKEAENLSRLELPNIIKVLEVFDENGTTYYVMQFIEGETLDDYIKHQRLGHLEADETKEIILSIAQALQYMHEKRMLHLDLKPKNIMRGTDGTEYIIDFGLSKQYDEKGEPESSTAIGLGTPGYAPTEQAEYIPDGTFPATLDIYALGATLYKMLTGKTPPSANEVLNNGLPTQPAYVSTAMWNVVEHAMQPRKKDRPQNIAEFLAILDTDNTEMTQVRPEKDDETEVSIVLEPVSLPSPSPNPTSTTRLFWPYIAAVVGVCIGLGSLILKDNKGTDTPIVIPSTEEESHIQAQHNQQTIVEPDLKEDESPSSQTFTANGVSFKMIRMDGGTFTMGATSEQDRDANDDEKPAHNITLSTFYIGEAEVTQALWKAVMGSNPSKNKGANKPVEMVSWDDCQEFISKLNLITGRNFRLPTEAEWEFAARGGNKSQGYKYSGSNEIKDVAWYEKTTAFYGNSSGLNFNHPEFGTHNVKTKKANELGIYDMSGNVSEWCSDCYSSYSSETQINSMNPSSIPYHVIRGGSWYGIAKSCRVSNRDYYNNQANNLGLRLAL